MEKYKYPKIKEIVKSIKHPLNNTIIDEITFETEIRIKRSDVWYDVNVQDKYYKGYDEKERFMDKLVMTKIYYQPKLFLKVLKISQNQEDTFDGLDSEENIKRITEDNSLLRISKIKNPQ